MSALRTELGLTGAISLNDSLVRKCLFKRSGAISLDDSHGVLYDKLTSYTPVGTTVNTGQRAIAKGWNGTSLLRYTMHIASNVWFYTTGSVTTSLWFLLSSPNQQQLINDGYLIGSAGYAGTYDGGQGFIALRASTAMTVENNGQIGGGGGGGASGSYSTNRLAGGNGAGTNVTNMGSNGQFFNNYVYIAGGYGGGAGASGGNGNSDYDGYWGYVWSGAGGGGAGGAGGGSYYQGRGYTYGGAAGACTNGSATYMTWVATGTRYGTIG